MENPMIIALTELKMLIHKLEKLAGITETTIALYNEASRIKSKLTEIEYEQACQFYRWKTNQL